MRRREAAICHELEHGEISRGYIGEISMFFNERIFNVGADTSSRVARSEATGSRSLCKSSYAGKQDAAKAVGNKPPPMKRKNNDSRGREIIGARSLRVPRRRGRGEERCPARSKDLHLHPAPGVRPDNLGADGREAEEGGKEETTPFYRSFRGEESQATPTHEIDPMINFQSRLNYAGRLSPIEEASPDSERAVCVVQKKKRKKKGKRRSREDAREKERGEEKRENERDRETASQSPLQPSNKRLFVLSRRGLCPRMRTRWHGDERVAARGAGAARIDAGHDCQDT